MSASRFRAPKTLEEEKLLLSEVVPKNNIYKYNTKWVVKLFEEWQRSRSNTIAQRESVGVEVVDVSNVEDLRVPLEQMSAYSVNVWLCKFICEAAKITGERYPSKTLYLLACGINRHLSDVKGDTSFSDLDRRDRRFMPFRKILDGEMKDATKCGVAQASKMEEKNEITEKEEAIIWNKGLRGSNTAESLLHSVCFYKGKLFGLRAGEHRLLRLSNIVVKENMVIFDEFRCKTYKGGLKDLNNKPRYIEHICHEIWVSHSPCLASLYSLISKRFKAIHNP